MSIGEPFKCSKCGRYLRPPDTTNVPQCDCDKGVQMSILPEKIELNDGICHICKNQTDSLNGNPSMWPIYLPHFDGQGKHRYYHIKCLYTLIKRVDKAVEKLNAKSILSLIEAKRKDKCRGCEYEFDRNNYMLRQIKDDNKRSVTDEKIADLISAHTCVS